MLPRERTAPKDAESPVFRTLGPSSASQTFGEFSDGIVHGIILPRFMFLEERAHSANIIKSISLKRERRMFHYSVTPIHDIMDGFSLRIKSVGLKLRYTAECPGDLGKNVEF